jgi:transposase-like protein
MPPTPYDEAHCPACGDGDLEGESIDIEGGHAFQRVTCLACRAKWTDQYQLQGYVDLERQLAMFEAQP